LRNGLRCLMVTNNFQDDEDDNDDDINDESDQDETEFSSDKLTSSDADEVFLQYHLVRRISCNDFFFIYSSFIRQQLHCTFQLVLS